MTTTGGYTSEQLAAQAQACELSRFTIDDAVHLGLLATERATSASLPIVIEVRHLGRLAYRVALPGSLPDSDDWIQRKTRVVERYLQSTIAVRVRHEEKGTTFNEATGLSELEYAAHGGGCPVVVTGVGVVGGFYASGLPQVADHEFLVACLTDFKATQSS
ncbi:MAG: heme-degrading domain-containing protein [Actinomycetes bacterium]